MFLELARWIKEVDARVLFDIGGFLESLSILNDARSIPIYIPEGFRTEDDDFLSITFFIASPL